MTARIVFSESAREDRRAITAYTVERFGLAQARRLRDNLAHVLITLADNPMIGACRPDLDPPGHKFRYFVMMKRFIIVYQPAETGLRIVRILNGMRNLAAELERDAGDRNQKSP